MLFLSYFVSALIAALLQLVAHMFVQRWFPRMEFTPRYVIGSLCMLTPPTATMLIEGYWMCALLIWVCVAASGLAVMGIREYEERQNELRDKLDKLARYESREQNRDLEHLLKGIDNAPAEQTD